MPYGIFANNEIKSLTKEGFCVNIVLTKHRGEKMNHYNLNHDLHSVIDSQQDKIYKLEKKIDSLEQDKLDLFTGYTVLIKTIQEQKEEIAQLKGENNGK